MSFAFVHGLSGSRRNDQTSARVRRRGGPRPLVDSLEQRRLLSHGDGTEVGPPPPWNFVPDVTAIYNYGSGDEGFPIAIDGEFLDYDYDDNAHEVWIDWGDGTTSVYLPGAAYQGDVLSGVVDPATGHAYYLVDRKTFADAEAFAQSLGGHLASISSNAEHDLLWNAFSGFNSGFPFPPQNDIWIGLTDSEAFGGTEGNFVWTSGEPVTYTNWGRGEPNNAGGNEDFVSFYGSQGGRWNDWGNNYFRSVVELPRPINFPDNGQSRYFSAMHAYADESPGGAYPIAITVRDQWGVSSAPAYTEVFINNLTPSIWLDGMNFAQEGTEGSFYFSPYDAGDDRWRVSIDYGDGSPTVVYETDELLSQYLRHTYAQQGTYTLRTTVTELDTGAVAEATSQIEVANVAPKLGELAISTTEADAGDAITVSGTVADPGPADSVTLLVDWGDGTLAQFEYDGGAGARPFSATHAYAADGYYPITITAADEDGGSDTADSTGEMPAGAFQWEGPDGNGHWYAGVDLPNYYDGIAGARAAAADVGAYVASITTESEQQMLVDRVLLNNPDDFYARYQGYWIGLSDEATEGDFRWDSGEALTYTNWHAGTGEPNEYWGDGTEDYVVMNWHYAHFYADAVPGTWNDMTAFAYGGAQVYRAVFEWDEVPGRMAVQVGKPVPALTIGPDASLNEGAPFSRAGAIHNGGAGAWAATVNYGEGDGPQPLALGAGNTFQLFRPYADDGTYTVTVRATRADGVTLVGSFTVTVANVAPSVTITGAPSWDMVEGTMITLTGVALDPGADALTYAWSVTRDGQRYDPPSGVSLTDFFQFFTSDDGQYVATLTVTDDDGAATVATSAAINVVNAAPVITGLSGPAVLVRGQPGEFTAGYFDPGWEDAVQQSIDVYNSAGEHVANALNEPLWFTSMVEGQYAVHVTTTDDDGGQAHEYVLLQVVAAHLWVNPENESDTVLVVGGTTAGDLIQVRPGAAPGWVDVVFGPDVVGQFAPSRGVVVYASDGNDGVYVAAGVGLPATVYGGAGDDAVYAGNSGGVIVGGDGNDILVGGDGRDILVGGNGADRLQGNGGEDILVSGRTAYDDMAVELNDIALEWRRTDRTYAQRVDALSGKAAGGYNGGSVFRTAADAIGPATVFDGSPGDVLTGNAGLDWYLLHTGTDRASDAGRTERVSPIVP